MNCQVFQFFGGVDAAWIAFMRSLRYARDDTWLVSSILINRFAVSE
ncbi:MAG TPA: hypothetical protein VMW28_00325 [Pelolinea sp.]|nr:hypothetical protein [Pelolinea sp.]